MATIINIAGFKGGAGKTTLSVHLANYIHFHLQKKVVLIGLSSQNELQFLHNLYKFSFYFQDMNIKYYKDAIEQYQEYDYIIFDFLSSVEHMDLHQLAHKIVVPTNSFTTDVMKTSLFLSEIHKAFLTFKTCLLPIIRVQLQSFNEVAQIKLIVRSYPVTLGTIIPYSKTYANLSEKYFKEYMFHKIRKQLDFIVHFKE